MDTQVKRNLILWTTLLAGPLFWLVSFQAKYSWLTWTCASQSKLALLVFALIALALTAGAGLLAWREWKVIGVRAPGEAADPVARSRFMALGAVVLNAGFFLTVLSQVIPDLLLGPCQ